MRFKKLTGEKEPNDQKAPLNSLLSPN